MRTWKLKQLSSKSLLLILLFSVSILIGSISWKFIDAKQVFNVEITKVSFEGGGQLCPVPLYDAEGNSYPGMVWGNIDNITYSGPAPLFDVDPNNYPDESHDDPCWYPEKVSPDIAVGGRKIYPLSLTVNLGNKTNNIRKGESTRLFADAQLLDQYPTDTSENSLLFAVAMENTAALDTYFSLETTNFEFSPPNEPINSSTLDFTHPTHQEWIISPGEDALGEQFFVVRLNDPVTGDQLAGSGITINVRDISGLNPTLVALLNASGTFLLGVFAILKIIPETWSLYKREPVKKPKRKKKRLPRK